MVWAVAALLITLQAAQPVNDLIPQPSDVRFQKIRKAAGEKDWPFVLEEGVLSCVLSAGRPQVYFFRPLEGKFQRPFLLDVNLLSMGIVNLGMQGVLAPYDDPEQLIARIAPFVAQGHMLCEQKDSPVFVPGSEL